MTDKRTEKQHNNKRVKQEFVDTMIYGLKAPLILPSSDSPVSDKMREGHKTYCLLEAAKCFETKKCPLYDVMIHISCISLIRPLVNAETNIYEWIFAKYEGWTSAFGDKPKPELEHDAKAVLDTYQRKLFEQQIKKLKEIKK